MQWNISGRTVYKVAKYVFLMRSKILITWHLAIVYSENSNESHASCDRQSNKGAFSNAVENVALTYSWSKP